jgi:hypothetical protein
MRNPDSLNVGESGCRENREHIHPNRPPTHFASDRYRAVANRDRPRVGRSDPRAQPTPQTTIEAVMLCVHERGLGALDEATNLERLSHCDESARAQINNRIAHLAEQNGWPR